MEGVRLIRLMCGVDAALTVSGGLAASAASRGAGVSPRMTSPADRCDDVLGRVGRVRVATLPALSRLSGSSWVSGENARGAMRRC